MNIGLLGFGSMGKVHAFSVANLPFFYDPLPYSARICGVCTRNYDNALSAAEKFGLGRAVSSEDELINDPSIDVIDVCTPNIYHYETVMKAIAAGKHVYCEKPLCVTEEQAVRLTRAAAEAGVTAGVVFNNRYLLPVMRAKELIDAGAIGDVVSFRGAYYHSSATDINKPASWKQDAAICGGGVLLDLGSHILDMIYYLCGPFSAVHGVSRIVYPERVGRDGSKWRTNAEEAFYITAHLKCGAVGTVETGKVFAGTNDDLSFEIFGTKGAVRFSLMEPNWLYYYDSAADTLGFQRIECCGRYPAPGGVFPGVKAPIGWLRGHIACMHAFLSAVHSSKEASPSFSEAAHIQSVMSAAYRSAASGKTEAVMYHE